MKSAEKAAYMRAYRIRNRARLREQHRAWCRKRGALPRAVAILIGQLLRIRRCDTCREVFKPRTNQHFCSSSCSSRQRMRPWRDCVMCQSPYAPRSATQTCCSLACVAAKGSAPRKLDKQEKRRRNVTRLHHWYRCGGRNDSLRAARAALYRLRQSLEAQRKGETTHVSTAS